MSEAVVVFDQVWKKFRRGERHDTLRDLVPSLAARFFRGKPPAGELASDQEFWAIRDVSFEVAAGAALGIIGPNGAGKSTTLKLLTRILKPSRGRCALKGRVGALIEIAAGFHPDLTGRENIYLQGAIMGMKRAEIARKLDAIIAFAGVDEFIDTPVKRYSSGMNARLGFSIAANLEPDALVIDEVLSVGDMAFQQRCVERMKEFKRQGVAIVFVSHNLQAVSGLCDQALLLKNSVQHMGSPHEVIRAYVRSSNDSDAIQASFPVQIGSATLMDKHGPAHGPIASGERLTLRVDYTAKENVRDLTFGFLVYRSNDNLVVYDANLTGDEVGIPEIRTDRSERLVFEFCAHLTRGHYHIECHVFHNPTQQFLGRLSPAAVFSVTEDRTWAGVANLDVRAVSPSARSRIVHDVQLVRGLQ